MLCLTAPEVQSWTLTDMMFVLAEVENLVELVVAVLGCWTLTRLVVVAETLMYEMFADTGSGCLMGLMGSIVNLDATVSAAPQHCGLT